MSNAEPSHAIQLQYQCMCLVIDWYCNGISPIFRIHNKSGLTNLYGLRSSHQGNRRHLTGLRRESPVSKALLACRCVLVPAKTHIPMPTTKPSFGGTRRQILRWALANAWKLSGLTAVVALVGTMFPVALSLLLRPTPIYWFPLLSDVDRNQPEGSVLRIAIFITSSLFFATTTASILHCHTLHLIANTADRNIFTHNLHAHSSMDIEPEGLVVPEPVPISPTPPTPRRRSGRLSTTNTLLLVSLASIVTFSVMHQPMPLPDIANAVRNIAYMNLLYNLGFYMLIISFILAMSFLIWYFLRLQNLPDCPPLPPETPISDVSGSPTEELFEKREQLQDDECVTKPQTAIAKLSEYSRAFLIWCVVLLRPVCLTGQAVCIIKIVGLWLALDNFSIANIRIVKITLLAALAFMEYTAAFFFSFFMTILAVDMRSKAPPPELIPFTWWAHHPCCVISILTSCRAC